MNLKSGYQQTDIGVIPEDWKVKQIGEIANVSSGATPDRQNPTYWNGDIPWITTSLIDFNLISEANEFITYKGLENSAARIYTPGTLLVAMYGQGKTRGKVAVLAISAATNQACAAIKINNSVSKEYVFYNLSSRYLEIRSLSNTGNQENLNSRIIKDILIPLPPLPEQRAIAAALSDVDNLITALDTLIAKQRDIKQATMQQLLTGRTRLPGFAGAWATKRLGDVADVKTGPFGAQLHESDYVPDGTPIITVEHLGELGINCKDTPPMVSDSDKERLKQYILRQGDVVFSRVGSIDRNALVSESEDGWLFSGRLLRVRPTYKMLPAFLSYYFQTEEFKTVIRGMAVGQTMASLNTSILNNALVVIPDFAEQTAIAAVLSDMDAQIEALERQRDKTRALKHGMMQELLTGNTRLL